MYGKSNMETYITICKIDSQRKFAVCLRKLKQELCISLEGWDEEGDEREVQKGEDICIPMADSCRGLTENNKILESNYPSIKKKFFLKKNFGGENRQRGDGRTFSLCLMKHNNVAFNEKRKKSSYFLHIRG